MKCNNCGSKWETDASRSASLTICPFCQAYLTKCETPKFFSSVKETLSFVANNKFTINNKTVDGCEILLSEKIVSFFSDMAPTLKDEKDLIKIIRDKGALEVLKGAMNESPDEQEIAIKIATSKLPAFMDKEVIVSILYEFAEALGWRIKQKIMKSNPITIQHPTPLPRVSQQNLTNTIISSPLINSSLQKPTVGVSIEKRGNTIGNVVNGGLVAMQDDWVYYKNVLENNRICKMRTNGENKLRLNCACYGDINVLNDWVYYSNGSGLLKVKTDGTNVQIIDDDVGRYLNIVDDWIYYSNLNDSDKLYRIRINGADKEKLNNHGSEYVNVVGSWVYYNMNKSGGNGFCKIGINGNNEQLLNNISSEYINIINESIYFLNKHGHLLIMNEDGTGIQKISDNNMGSINIEGDWVYYQNKDDYGKLYRIKTDGTCKQKLNNNYSHSIHIIGEWIYYFDDYYDNNYGNLYRVRTDGASHIHIC